MQGTNDETDSWAIDDKNFQDQYSIGQITLLVVTISNKKFINNNKYKQSHFFSH